MWIQSNRDHNATVLQSWINNREYLSKQLDTADTAGLPLKSTITFIADKIENQFVKCSCIAISLQNYTIADKDNKISPVCCIENCEKNSCSRL